MLPGYKLNPHTRKINDELEQLPESGNPVLVAVEKAKLLIAESYAGMDPKEGNVGNTEDQILSALSYLTSLPEDPDRKNKVYVLIQKNRNVSRMKTAPRPENSPHTKQQKIIAQQYAGDVPVLVMFQQNGEGGGWRSGPFWWPVLFVPKNIRPAIYASETREPDFTDAENV